MKLKCFFGKRRNMRTRRVEERKERRTKTIISDWLSNVVKHCLRRNQPKINQYELPGKERRRCPMKRKTLFIITNEDLKTLLDEDKLVKRIEEELDGKNSS